MVSKVEPYRYAESGLSNVTLIGIEVRSCPKCGERAAAIPAIAKLHDVLARLLVDKPSRLAGEEIRFLRTYLGKSTSDFANLMGVTRENVSRWENDQTPIGSPADRLLRMLVVHVGPNHDYDLDQLSNIEKNKAAKTAPLRIQRADATWQLAS
jgi:putative zinc finger/helix-turn-helix YgiT family protein